MIHQVQVDQRCFEWWPAEGWRGFAGLQIPKSGVRMAGCRKNPPSKIVPFQPHLSWSWYTWIWVETKKGELPAPELNIMPAFLSWDFVNKICPYFIALPLTSRLIQYIQFKSTITSPTTTRTSAPLRIPGPAVNGKANGSTWPGRPGKAKVGYVLNLVLSRKGWWRKGAVRVVQLCFDQNTLFQLTSGRNSRSLYQKIQLVPTSESRFRASHTGSWIWSIRAFLSWEAGWGRYTPSTFRYTEISQNHS